MHIHSVEFVVGAVRPADLPTDGLIEVAFSGRSNVGKSSLINRLAQRRKLARTSSTPGKTQQLNYYRLNDALYLVDLPGYGYVQGGAALRRELGRLVENYVETRKELRVIVQLVDARHGPTDLDTHVIEWLLDHQKPFLLVFTKADKLSPSRLNRRLDQLEGEGKLAGIPFAPFSALTGQGRADILEWIIAESGMKP